MLALRQDARLATQVNVIPQVVARAFLLELTQEELEECVREKLDENPALELVGPPPPIRTPGPPDSGLGSDDRFARLPAPTSFRDDLLWQLRAECDGEEFRLAAYIVENLDERGYLASTVFELADDLEVSEERIEEALAVVQELEPRGVGARGLAECLKLQVLPMKCSETPPGLLDFLEGEFTELVEQRNARALESPASAEAEEFLEFIREKLYPYPADLFRPPYPTALDQLPAQPPDVVVERNEGRLVVTVPMSERLALRVNGAYARLARNVDRHAAGESVGKVKELVAEGKEFLSNLTHRHRVMALVATTIIAEQEEYLRLGPRAMKPFTKKELAQKLGLHESTVCRATRGKSIMLPEGEVIPFAVFFEDALPAKVTLAQIVRKENPAKPYTDSALVAALGSEGYPLARRTISKYRAALEIPSASQRRVHA